MSDVSLVLVVVVIGMAILQLKIEQTMAEIDHSLGGGAHHHAVDATFLQELVKRLTSLGRSCEYLPPFFIPLWKLSYDLSISVEKNE